MSERRPLTVLVVDDEASVRFTLRAILEEESTPQAPLCVEEAADGDEALRRIERGDIAMVITDLSMPGRDGMALLRALEGRVAAPPVVMVTAHGSERVAVEAMKLGALDYFSKPFDPDQIARVVRRTLALSTLVEENRRLRAGLWLGQTMVFASDAMQRVAERVERVADKDVTVLITGQSGTGKELVARALVRGSARAERPYLRCNCAALSPELAEAELFGHARGAFTGAVRARPGLFREADGGTLLLDEIGELDPGIQGTLLRVLQEGEVRPVGQEHMTRVDVRVLAATNRDLRAEVAAGRFREDLRYRLDVVEIHVPPLRERRKDVLPLAEHFVDHFARRFGLGPMRLSPAVRDRLLAHPWPGNVRELEHCLERMVALATGPVLDDVALGDPRAEAAGSAEPAEAAPERLSLKERMAALERGLLVEELRRCEGNHSEMARRLRVSRVTLLDKLRRHGLR